MRSLVFNSPMVVMWFTIGGSVLVGCILTMLVVMIFKNLILRKSIEARIPEITEAYKSDLADMEYIISQNVDIIERLESQAQKDKERKAEASIHAMKIIQAVSDGHQ